MKKVLLGIVGLVAAGIVTPALAAGDPVEGEKVFRKCKACHPVEPGKKRVGPTLYEIVGSKAAQMDGYRYSDAMQKMAEEDHVWTEEVLMEYLIDPRKYVPGTKMAFPGLKKEEDRADVIAYLKSISE